ncbi:MAG: methyltransferase domain-containing protein [Deltaproteobacteria bacterium]|nr:methyltransferase domain-containing protein [Deltaproteobacteria bacterium]
MDLRLLKQVNDLWRKVYPYLADHVMEYYGRSHGDVLELGPFAGGISLELATRHPGLNITVAAQDSGAVDLLKKEIEGAGLGGTIEVKQSEWDPLVFADLLFDLVIFRGAYFFLDKEGSILREIDRVLKEGGLGFIGGGYGKDTPRAVIDEIADVSRDLNDRLGRIRVSVDDVRNMAKGAGLTPMADIEKEGGLWLIIRK